MSIIKSRERDEVEEAIVATVRQFVERKVIPAVRELEHADEYPLAFIETMKDLGIFGLTIPEAFGGSDVSMSCYVRVTAELARGWMSLAGAMGGHSVVATLIERFGTPEQQEHFLSRMATGEIRAAMALTEEGGGSDLQAIRTKAVRQGDEYVVDGSKIWITNARRAQTIALLCRTDPEAVPSHRGMSILLVDHGPGLTVSRDLPKLGYKGVESCELVFEDYHCPADRLLGGVEHVGFSQMMRGLETGRLQVAARALGVAQAALEDSLAYAQERQTFGKPIWEHQSIGNYLADMVTKYTAARELVQFAARSIDDGKRSDLEAGMAKLYASEVAMELALNAMRIHGAYGYSTELNIERYFRDAPLMIVGEGTNEIQRNVIIRELIRRGGQLP